MGQSAGLVPHLAASAAVNGMVCQLCVRFQHILFPPHPAVPTRVLGPRTLDILKPACVSRLLFFFFKCIDMAAIVASESHVYRTQLYIGAFVCFVMETQLHCNCDKDLFSAG